MWSFPEAKAKLRYAQELLGNGSSMNPEALDQPVGASGRKTGEKVGIW